MGQFRYRKVLENNRMFPQKSTMVDCVDEVNWLYSTIAMDGDTLNTYVSPFRTPITNRYSSSTDSTSPESNFNSPFQLTQTLEHKPITYESRYDSQAIFYDSPTHTLESPSLSFNSHPSYTRHARCLTDFEPQNFSTSTSFDRSFPVSEQQSSYQGIINDIPFALRHQNPKVGRKILGCHSNTHNETLRSDNNFEFKIWQPTNSSPEKVQVQYELFPSNENKYEFCTPKKSTNITDYRQTSSPSSSTMSTFVQQTPPDRTQYENWSQNTSRTQNLSPTSYSAQNLSRTSYTAKSLSSISNKTKNFTLNSLNRVQNMSQTLNKVPYPEFKPPYNPSLYAGASSSSDGGKMCTFCRKNGESACVYMNHVVKEKIGNKYVVTCPILRALVCSICGASGDDAHTITYCPVLRSTNNGLPLQSTTVTLKNTRIKSDGRKRY